MDLGVCQHNARLRGVLDSVLCFAILQQAGRAEISVCGFGRVEPKAHSEPDQQPGDTKPHSVHFARAPCHSEGMLPLLL